MVKRHSERCRACKVKVFEMLKQLDADAVQNYNTKLPSFLTGYAGVSFQSSLEKIYASLEANRGYRNFVRTKKMPNVDFFLPSVGIIVEFDESQHFTLPRNLTLSLYPDELDLGFDKSKWASLCRHLDKRDNDPPYRDEQRAWYDTLRDFAPSVLDLKPTVRLYASDHIWCALDIDNQDDVALFSKKIFQGSHET